MRGDSEIRDAERRCYRARDTQHDERAAHDVEAYACAFDDCSSVVRVFMDID